MSLKAGRVGVNPADVDPIDGHISPSATDAYTKQEADDKFQTKLSFDDVPVNGSNNPVKSDGIYDALAPKVSESLLKDTVGWVGKNKLPITLAMLKAGNTGGTWSGNTYTQNGVVFTITTNAEGYVTQIDTHTATSASGNVNLQLTENRYIANTFVGDIATGFTDGTAEYYFNINYSNDGSTWNSQVNQTTVPVTISNKPYIKLAIHVDSGATVNHSKSYPMLRDASITDSTFEPYHESVAEILHEIPLPTELLTASQLKACVSDAADFSAFKTNVLAL